jgi:hypothetical protein
MCFSRFYLSLQWGIFLSYPGFDQCHVDVYQNEGGGVAGR